MPMRYFKWFAWGMTAIALCGVIKLGVEETSEKGIETASFEQSRFYESSKRPFSWYYPNQYQYYYPRKQVDSCYWIYSNGSYFYKCS